MKNLSPQEFLKEHPQPVILHFQPTSFLLVESDEEFRRWEAALAKMVGLKVEGTDWEHGTYTHTKCGDPNTYEGIDDCEND